MQAELVQCQTPDAVQLHGAFIASPAPPVANLDAALLLHGLAGNFYSSQLLTDLARLLSSLGIAVVQANTRGHDGLNWTSMDVRTVPLGAAFEKVDDCRHDVAGWLNFLEKRQCRRVALVGHSLGAIKAIYAQAHQPHPNVCAIAALSTSRLNYHRFLQSPAASKFQRWLDESQRLIDAGASRQLMQVDFPFPAFISAEAYLDKYGPANQYDWTGFAHQLDVPLLLTFGERELSDNEAFRDMLADVDRLKQSSPAVECQVIPGANHFYIGRRQVVSRAVRDWLEARFPPAEST